MNPASASRRACLPNPELENSLGYERQLGPRRRYDRSTPDSRHFKRHVRFRIVFFCFSEMSGPIAGLSVESESDAVDGSRHRHRDVPMCGFP